jgi:predicted GNAT family acetyltransferase
VRRIRPGDGARIRTLRLAMVADTPIAYGETVDGALTHPLERWTRQASENATGDAKATFVAEAGEAFVGTATGLARGDRTMLVSVYVAPEHRGTGLVDQLVEAVRAWSSACGRPEVALLVARENPRALAAYVRLGFVATGVTEAHPLYPGVTEQEMVRRA